MANPLKQIDEFINGLADQIDQAEKFQARGKNTFPCAKERLDERIKTLKKVKDDLSKITGKK